MPEPRARLAGLSLCLVLGLAVATRMDDVIYAGLAIDSDSALGALMGREVWSRPGYLPLMLDGQDYLGAMEAYLYAPFNALLPTAQAMACAQLIMAVALVWLCAALLEPAWRCRASALAGSLALAIGTPWITRYTTAIPLGYLSNLLIGLTLIAVAHHLARREPGPRGLAGLAALAGLGFWNNPQVLPFVAAAGLALVPHTALVARRAELPGALWAPAARGPAVLLAGGLVALALTLALPALQLDDLGPISLRNPAKYPPRAIALCGAAAILLELALARERVRWLRGAAAAVGGAVLGGAPFLAYKLLWPQEGIPPGIQFRADMVLHNWTDVSFGAGQMVLGPTALGELAGGSAYAAWRAFAPLAIAAALAAWLFARRAAWLDLLQLRARAVPLDLLVALPGALTGLQLLLRGGIQWPRYFIALVPTLVVVVGAGFHALWSRGHRRLAVAWLAALMAGYAAQQIDQGLALARHPDVEERLIARLERRGLTHGYAQYWVAYRFACLSDGALVLHCNYDGGGNYNRWRRYGEEVAPRQRDLVRLFDHAVFEDPSLVAEFLDSGDRMGRGAVRERLSAGRYLALRYDRRP